MHKSLRRSHATANRRHAPLLPLRFLVAIALNGALAPTAHAQVPRLISKEGRVSVNGTHFNGTSLSDFASVDDGGTSNTVSPPVTKGLYSVLPGDTTITNTMVAKRRSHAPAIRPHAARAPLGYSVATAVSGASPLAAHAPVPRLISYQGRVSVNGTNFNGTGLFEFALVDGGGTSNYWSNDGTPVGQPNSAVSLSVTKGLYSVLLGDTTIANMMVAIPATVFANSNVWLRVWFNDGVNGWQQLTPDQRIAAVGYALQAENANVAAVANSLSSTGISIFADANPDSIMSIGTTNRDATLSVNGSIKANNLIFSDGSSMTTVASGGGIITLIDVNELATAIVAGTNAALVMRIGALSNLVWSTFLPTSSTGDFANVAEPIAAQIRLDAVGSSFTLNVTNLAGVIHWSNLPSGIYTETNPPTLSETFEAGSETGTKTQVFGTADGNIPGVFGVANGNDVFYFSLDDRLRDNVGGAYAYVSELAGVMHLSDLPGGIFTATNPPTLAQALAAGDATGTKTQIFGSADGTMQGVFDIATGTGSIFHFKVDERLSDNVGGKYAYSSEIPSTADFLQNLSSGKTLQSLTLSNGVDVAEGHVTSRAQLRFMIDYDKLTNGFYGAQDDSPAVRWRLARDGVTNDIWETGVNDQSTDGTYDWFLWSPGGDMMRVSTNGCVLIGPGIGPADGPGAQLNIYARGNPGIGRADQHGIDIFFNTNKDAIVLLPADGTRSMLRIAGVGSMDLAKLVMGDFDGLPLTNLSRLTFSDGSSMTSAAGGGGNVIDTLEATVAAGNTTTNAVRHGPAAPDFYLGQYGTFTWAGQGRALCSTSLLWTNANDAPLVWNVGQWQIYDTGQTCGDDLQAHSPNANLTVLGDWVNDADAGAPTSAVLLANHIVIDGANIERDGVVEPFASNSYATNIVVTTGSIDAQASFYSSEFPTVSGAIIQPYTEDPGAKIYSANIVRRISNEVRAVFYFIPTHGSLGAAQSQTVTNDVQFWRAQ